MAWIPNLNEEGDLLVNMMYHCGITTARYAGSLLITHGGLFFVICSHDERYNLRLDGVQKK